MPSSSYRGYFQYLCMMLMLCSYSRGIGAHAIVPVTGHVTDTNGNGVQQASVTVSLGADHGADLLTLFTNDDGDFASPMPVPVNSPAALTATARKPGYGQIFQSSRPIVDNQPLTLSIIMRASGIADNNAPASAWLAGMEQDTRENLIRRCAGCHQMPSRAMLDYAGLIEHSVRTLPGAQPEEVRRQSWDMIQHYMVMLAEREGGSEALADALPGTLPPADAALQSLLGRSLADHFSGSLDAPRNHSRDTPLLSSQRTVIVEYKYDRAGGARDVFLMGARPRFWMAGDSSESALLSADLASEQILPVPLPTGSALPAKPNTVQRGADGTLWLSAAAGSGVIARFDVNREAWRGLWQLKAGQTSTPGVRGLAYNFRHEVTPDPAGRIWFAGTAGATLGFLVPETGRVSYFTPPELPGSPAESAAELGALVMSPDGNTLWYVQPRGGALGSIDTRTFEFGEPILDYADAGPQRPAISDDGILYVPLFVSGQLLVYDTKSGEKTLFDLPDRGSAPYAATYDHRRQAIWITTSNGDVLYHFDPEERSFAVLPLPRPGTYLRRIAIDPVSGLLVGTYADGSRWARDRERVLTIDPGDGAYLSPASRAEIPGDADAP